MNGGRSLFTLRYKLVSVSVFITKLNKVREKR